MSGDKSVEANDSDPLVQNEKRRGAISEHTSSQRNLHADPSHDKIPVAGISPRGEIPSDVIVEEKQETSKQDNSPKVENDEG